MNRILKTDLKDIVKTVTDDGSFVTVAKIIRATGMVETLRDTGLEFTLFAPNEKAFRKLIPGGRLRRLLKDKDSLTRVMYYHLLPGKYVSKHIDGIKPAHTLEGHNVLIDTTDLRINEAKVIRADIECANGILYEIDSVLMPPGVTL